MSRIHEALLRAQTERGLEGHEAPDFERLPEQEPTAAGVNQIGDTEVEPNSPSNVSVRAFPSAVWKPDIEKLVFLREEGTVGIEEFRSLRSRIFRERANRHLQTILIAGGNPGEGKSFVAANLAMAMACNKGQRTLLVDADLRRSTQHKFFGLEPSPGLSDFLCGKAQRDSIVHQTPDPQFCVVPSGKAAAGSTDLLQSARMCQFLNEMQKNFDWIVFDSPAVTAVADSAVLAEHADAILLVVTPGSPTKDAQKLKKDLAHRPILGVVLNRAERSIKHYQYYSESSFAVRRNLQTVSKFSRLKNLFDKHTTKHSAGKKNSGL